MKHLLLSFVILTSPWVLFAEEIWDEIKPCEQPVMYKHQLIQKFKPATTELILPSISAHVYSQRCHELTGCLEWEKVSLDETKYFGTHAYGTSPYAYQRFAVVSPFEIEAKAQIIKGRVFLRLGWESKYPTNMTSEYGSGNFEFFETYIHLYPFQNLKRTLDLDEVQASMHTDGCFYGQTEVQKAIDPEKNDFYTLFKIVLKTEKLTEE